MQTLTKMEQESCGTAELFKNQDNKFTPQPNKMIMYKMMSKGDEVSSLGLVSLEEYNSLLGNLKIPQVVRLITGGSVFMKIGNICCIVS